MIEMVVDVRWQIRIVIVMVSGVIQVVRVR